MSQRIPQISGMPQVIMQVPTQAELNDDAEEKMYNVDGQNVIIPKPAIGEVIAAAGAMANNPLIRLSKNKKMRMAHAGFTEIEQTWKTAPTWEADPITGTYEFSDKEERPELPIADTDDGIVITDPGTFTTTTGFKTEDANGDPLEPYTMHTYNNDASSSSANDGLVGPTVLALAADTKLAGENRILDNPGRTDGPEMTEENYLSPAMTPIVTSDTVVYAIAKIEAMRVAADASTLTVQDMVDAGIDSNVISTANLADYQTAVETCTDEITSEILSTIIVTVNEAA